MPVTTQGCLVYCLANYASRKTYVGSTVDGQRRFKEHLARLRRGAHHNEHLQRSFDKHGEASFEFFQLQQVDDPTKLEECENYWIDLLTPEYNMGTTARSAGSKRSAETRSKIADAKRGDRNPRFGRPSTRKGAVLSDETKAKISSAKRAQGSTRSAESTRMALDRANQTLGPQGRSERTRRAWDTRRKAQALNKVGIPQ